VLNQIIQGDCYELMKGIPDGSIDLVITSPPYANQRKDTYGGIDHKNYVGWFLPISSELKRVLAEDGSFILNIKENVIEGQRSLYVYHLVEALINQGWLWTEEYIWYKKRPNARLLAKSIKG
jgi:site-specific DNA-methyltransferase (adenine-specific)